VSLSLARIGASLDSSALLAFSFVHQKPRHNVPASIGRKQGGASYLDISQQSCIGEETSLGVGIMVNSFIAASGRNPALKMRRVPARRLAPSTQAFRRLFSRR